MTKVTFTIDPELPKTRIFVNRRGDDSDVSITISIPQSMVAVRGVTVPLPEEPTYRLTAVPDIDEGANLSVVLQTTGVAQGTLVGFSVTGISAADVTGSNLFGTFNIASDGTATAMYTLRLDLLTEGPETLNFALNNGKAAVSVLVNDTSITPVTPPPPPPPPPGPLSTIPAGVARNIGPWTEAAGAPGRPEQPGQRLDYSCTVYDKVGKRILMRGGHHGGNVTTNIRSLDLATLTYSDLMPNTPPADMLPANSDPEVGGWISTHSPWSRHTYGSNVVMPGRFYMLGEQNSHQAMNGQTIPSGWGRPAWWDFEAKTWTYSKLYKAPPGGANDPSWTTLPSAACAIDDRWIFVLARNQGSWGVPWLYDTTIDDAIKLPMSFGANGWIGEPCVAFYPPNGRVYAFESQGRVWEITVNPANPAAATSRMVADASWPAGTWTKEGRGFRETRIDYDPINQVLGGSLQSGTYVAFKPAAEGMGVWKQFAVTAETGTAVPTTAEMSHAGAFDQVSGCFITFERDGKCWAYRPPQFDSSAPPPPPGPTATTTTLTSSANPSVVGT